MARRGSAITLEIIARKTAVIAVASRLSLHSLDL